MKEMASIRLDELNGETTASSSLQDVRYIEAIQACAAMLSRLTRGYEKDSSRRQDLMQEIHVALWKSFESFDDLCALQTWVYRVAHNVAIRHMMNNKRIRLRELHTLEEIPEQSLGQEERSTQEQNESLQQLFSLIEQLKPLDRQVILLYLEAQDAQSISELTGLSTENVATKIHRIKKLLQAMFRERGLL
jgi:RNA polymerase sigma-70 factor (ECF subfamily)